MLAYELILTIIDNLSSYGDIEDAWIRYFPEQDELHVYFTGPNDCSGMYFEDLVFSPHIKTTVHIRNIYEIYEMEEGDIESILKTFKKVSVGNDLSSVHNALETCRYHFTRFKEVCSAWERLRDKGRQARIRDIYDDCACIRFERMIFQTGVLVETFYKYHNEKSFGPVRTLEKEIIEGGIGGDRTEWGMMLHIYEIIRERKEGIPFYELFLKWEKYLCTVKSTYEHYAVLTPGYSITDHKFPPISKPKITGNVEKLFSMKNIYANMIQNDAKNLRKRIDLAKQKILDDAQAESEDAYKKALEMIKDK